MPKRTVAFQAIVLAAGKGTRMGSDLPKVLHLLCGRPMVCRVLDALEAVGIAKPIIIVGRGAELVERTLGRGYAYVLQEQQLGSGHAVMCAREAAEGRSRHILVMCGDSPLFRAETVRALMDAHLLGRAAVSLTSATLDDPTGYGRIVRGTDGRITGVVEEKMAGRPERAIREINGGCYAFDSGWLWTNIGLMSENEAGEKCLTEMVDIAISQGKRVTSASCDPEEVLGVNTPEQLAEAERIMSGR